MKPETRLAAISSLWASDFSTAEIAKRLNMTKGTVCRLALDARLKGDLRFPPRNFGRKKAPAPKRPVEIDPRLKPMLVNLRLHDCKYPVFSGVARGDHHFCAEPQMVGSPYCAKHAALCVSARGMAGMSRS